MAHPDVWRAAARDPGLSFARRPIALKSGPRFRPLPALPHGPEKALISALFSRAIRASEVSSKSLLATSPSSPKKSTIRVCILGIFRALWRVSRLDGPAVVNGIFTIPLRAPHCGPAAASAAPRPALEGFVAGAENRLAAHAFEQCMARAGACYSPLLLYGPHGAGKSHLAQGLAAWWAEQRPEQPVVTLTAGDFARQYAAALSDHRLEDWRSELAEAALVVLEDLGQLATKRPAQQELLHLLDVLADREILVIVTSRSLPTQTTAFLPALLGRLSAGLTVGVALPGPATRRTLLEQLAAARGLTLTKRTLHGLADALPANVPTLAAALAELDLHARGDGQSLDTRRLRQWAGGREDSRRPPLRKIATLTAKYFGLTLADLKSPRRRQPLVAGRGVAMYLARQLTGKSFDEIGQYFGGRDHTTVLHGCRRTETLIARDRATRQAVAELKRLLHAS
ncbi:MAG: DnaA/Hda family protein [Pirellulales bacterium]